MSLDVYLERLNALPGAGCFRTLSPGVRSVAGCQGAGMAIMTAKG